MRKKIIIKTSLFSFLFFLALFFPAVKAQKTDIVPKEEFYINQDNLMEVTITGRVTKEDLVRPEMTIKVSLEDEVGNNVSRMGLINERGEFRVLLDASSLLDGEIKLNALVFVDAGETLFGEGGIKREEKIYDNLTILKDTHSPLRLTLYSVTTPTAEEEQIVKGEKPKNTSVWLNEHEIVKLNADSFWTYKLGLSEGDNKIFLTLKDKSGNESEPVEAHLVYDPTLISRGSLTFRERADASGLVDINVRFNKIPQGLPQIAINTEYGEDTPPTAFSGTGMFWAYEYQGSSHEGLGQVTVLIKDPSTEELYVAPLSEPRTFRVNAYQDKEIKSTWKLPPPPDPSLENPRPEFISTSTLAALDKALPEIHAVRIIDPFPRYKNGGTVHLEVEYEDKSYEFFKDLLKLNYQLDDRYSYLEKDFSQKKSAWYPLRTDFSQLDSGSVNREIRVGEAVLVGNDRYKRTVSYKIDLNNTQADGEIPIEVKVTNILGRESKSSLSVDLANAAPVTVDREILEGFEQPLSEEVAEILLQGNLNKVEGEGYISLLIYSDPLVETIKTDKFGRWTYTLKRPLESGEHLIYGAEVDRDGNLGEVVQLASFIVPAKAAEGEPTQAVNIEDLESVIEKVSLPGVAQEKRRFPLGEVFILASLFIFSGVVIVLGFAPFILKRLGKNEKRL